MKSVLYLVANYDLLQFVSGFFRSTQCRVAFGLERDWHAQLLDMPVSCGSVPHGYRFRETLSAVNQDSGTSPIQSSLFV